jgi:hypothetical protein
MNLLLVAIVLWVVGFLLEVIAGRMRPRVTGEDKSLLQLIIEAIQEMIAAIRRLLGARELWEQLQAFGSLLFWAGVAVFIVWAVQGMK